MNQHWIPFWVGLLDGDGSIQVNHWRFKSLQYRIMIKLKYTESNEEMLKFLCKSLKVGSVRVDSKKQFVLWVENNKSQVLKLLQILEKYPPLTSRLQCQINFVNQSILKSMDWYLKHRELKYESQDDIIRNISRKNITQLSYFSSWFSGFIEAEGCFCIKNLNHKKAPVAYSFSIGQKKDNYLIIGIKSYLSASNKIREIPNNFYSVEVYKLRVLLDLENHLEKFPLKGEKKVSADRFYYSLKTSKWYFLFQQTHYVHKIPYLYLINTKLFLYRCRVVKPL